jgi:hypothetical protein
LIVFLFVGSLCAHWMAFVSQIWSCFWGNIFYFLDSLMISWFFFVFWLSPFCINSLIKSLLHI